MPSDQSGQHFGKLFLAAFVLLALMTASAYYVFPSGETLDFKGFVLLWLRELIILAFVLALFIAIGIGRSRRQRKGGSGGNSAP